MLKYYTKMSEDESLTWSISWF